MAPAGGIRAPLGTCSSLFCKSKIVRFSKYPGYEIQPT